MFTKGEKMDGKHLIDANVNTKITSTFQKKQKYLSSTAQFIKRNKS